MAKCFSNGKSINREDGPLGNFLEMELHDRQLFHVYENFLNFK